MSIKNVILAINVRWWNAEAAYAINLARGLRKSGINVKLIVNPDSPVHHKAVAYQIPVITDILLDSLSPITQFKNLKKLLSYIDKYQIELVNTFKSNGAFLFSLARKLRPELCYIKTRGIAKRPVNNFINRYLYGPGSCDGIITVGKSVQNWMEELLKKSHQQRIKTVYYGDSPVEERLLPDQDKTDNPFDVKESQKTFCLLGRTQRIKGHLLLLQAFHQLKPSDFHIVFLVKDLEEFPEELEELETYISEHKLQDNVSILGFQPNLDRFLSKVDCGVIPSLESEVNCRVCVEFFSKGIPVISFPTGTLPDLIHHRQNGFLCEEKSVESLIEGIRWAYENPDEFRAAETAALRDYQNHYTLARLAEKTLLFYTGCQPH